MTIMYVSLRPIRLGALAVSPKEQLKYSFPDVPLTFTSFGINTRVDGRMLYEINYSGDAGHKAEILAGLSMWGAREISLENAKTLAAAISTKQWTDDGKGKLVAPEEPSKPTDPPKIPK